MSFYSVSQTHTHTLHYVIMPAVRELPVISILVQSPKEDLVRVTVFQMN